MADRFASTYTGHDHPFGYYFLRFWDKDFFMPWLLLLPVPFYLIFKKQTSPLRDISVLMFLCSSIQLLIVSFSGTKTDHYDVVAYPPMAMLAGIGLWQVVQDVSHFWKSIERRAAVFALVVLAGAFLVVCPYSKIIDIVYKPRIPDRTMTYGYLLRKIQKTRPNCKEFTIFSPVYTGQVNYYAGLLNRKHGYNIKLSEHPKLVEVGDTVLACESKMIDTLLAHYELQPIETEGKCFLAVAKEKKNGGLKMEN